MGCRVVAAVVITTLAIAGCDMLLDSTGPAPDSGFVHRGLIDPGDIGDADHPLTVPLIAGQSTDIGSVSVWVEHEALYVKYSTSWSLVETQMHIAPDPAEFPRTTSGNPRPGQFDFKMNHAPGTSTWTYVVPYPELRPADVVFIAAHADVEHWVDGSVVASEGAWADGLEFPGNSWATYLAGAVRLTDMWDVTLNIWGEVLGPFPLYMVQTGNEIQATYDLTGTFDGSRFRLEGEPLGPYFILDGELSPDGTVISGDILENGEGNTFTIERPTSYRFGHLDFAGVIQGTEVSLDTEWALVEDTSGDPEVSFLLVGYGWNDFEKGADIWISVPMVISEVPLGVPVETWISMHYTEFDGDPDVWGQGPGMITVTRYDGEWLTASFSVFGPEIDVTGLIDTGVWESPM